MRKIIVTTAALLASTSAFAQTAMPSAPTSAPVPAQQPEVAATAPVEQTVDDPNDIIVTAQKREQSLQSVSAAVSAVTSDRLVTAQVASLQDLQTIVPSVNFGSDFNQAKIFIRGVGANTSTTGSSTGVAFHVDGAYVARAEAQLTSLFDLERVEVLRGPQGTLYGRNAVGGSINLITAKPTEALSGYARATYGAYNSIIGEAAIGGQIIPGVKARLAVRSENRDGFGRNPISGADVDDLSRRMARLQLAFDLGPQADFLLSGEYFRQNDSSGAVHYLRASFPGVARLAPLGVGGYATAPRDLATESQPGTDTETYSITGTFHYKLSDTLGITNITNYRSFRSSLYQDLDLSAVIDAFPLNGQPTTIQERRIDSKQFSNELQLNYNTDLMNAVIATYYFTERQRPIDNVGYQRRNGLASNIAILNRDGIDLGTAYDLCGYGPGSVGGTIVAPKRVCTHSNLYDETVAVFGQTEIHLGALSDSLRGISLKLGGRFSGEKVTSENPGIVIRYSAAVPAANLNALPTLIYTPAGTHRERNFKDFTPEAGLSWEPKKDLLLYYTYSEGFKAGSPENASGSTTIVDPEKVANHEVGIKATIARGFTANLALYSYTLTGLQLNKTISGGPTGYTTIFQNAAKTRAKGFEFEVFARPVPAVRLSGAVSYTDAHFVDYLTLDPLNPANVAGGTPYNAVTNPDPTAFGAPGGGNIQLAGNDVRNSPRWAGNVHGEFDLTGEDAFVHGQLTASGDVSYKSRTYFSEFERAIESSAPFAMVDGALSYRTADRRIKMEAFVKNAFDVFRPSSTFALATGRLLGATYLPPRTYGFSVGYNF